MKANSGNGCCGVYLMPEKGPVLIVCDRKGGTKGELISGPGTWGKLEVGWCMERIEYILCATDKKWRLLQQKWEWIY